MKEMPHMNTHLPADLEQFVQAKVRSGRFTSSDEAITAAVRLPVNRKKPRKPASWRASARAWTTCEPAAPSPWPKRSPTSAATWICPTVHEIPHRAGRNRQGEYSRPGPMATRVHIARRRHEMAGWTVQGHRYPSNAAPERPG